MFVGEENKSDMDWAWVDFIEGDVEPDLEKDMKQLLRLSGEQRKALETMLWAREMIKSVDPSHEDYLKNWNRKKTTSKIMDVCDKIQRDKWIEQNWSKKAKWLTLEQK